MSFINLCTQIVVYFSRTLAALERTSHGEDSEEGGTD